MLYLLCRARLDGNLHNVEHAVRHISTEHAAVRREEEQQKRRVSSVAKWERVQERRGSSPLNEESTVKGSSKVNQLDKSKRTCFECGEEGHEARFCPKKKKKQLRNNKGNKRGSNVVEQGDGTYWAMMVRAKDADGFERVGQRPITVADFNIRHGVKSQAQRKAEGKALKNPFECLADPVDVGDEVPEVPSAPPAGENSRPKPKKNLPGKNIIVADRAGCSCRNHTNNGSCGAPPRSESVDRSVSKSEEVMIQASADGAARARASWPTRSFPASSGNTDSKVVDRCVK